MERKQNPILTALFWLWVILLIPCIPFIPLSAMAFDAGYTLDAYLVFWSVASYPVTVGIAALTRKKVPGMVFLPLLNFVVPIIVDMFERFKR
jgi:hypothetical protein